MRDTIRRAEPASAIEQLYREHGDRMWRALVAWGGNADVATDAVAEAFTQALRRGAALRDPLAWIWRAAFRIAAGELKGRRTPALTVPAAYELDEPAVDLVRALAKLSRRQRTAVVLHHAADYPVREVARLLGTSSAAVRVHLTRGRRRLRQLLEESDAEDR